MFKIVRGNGGCLGTFLHVVIILVFQKANSYFLINLKFQIKLLDTTGQNREHIDLLKKEQIKTAKNTFLLKTYILLNF